jgi:hypothetical protein
MPLQWKRLLRFHTKNIFRARRDLPPNPHMVISYLRSPLGLMNSWWLWTAARVFRLPFQHGIFIVDISAGQSLIASSMLRLKDSPSFMRSLFSAFSRNNCARLVILPWTELSHLPSAWVPWGAAHSAPVDDNILRLSISKNAWKTNLWCGIRDDIRIFSIPEERHETMSSQIWIPLRER